MTGAHFNAPSGSLQAITYARSRNCAHGSSAHAHACHHDGRRADIARALIAERPWLLR
jgi:hypothetical protein